MSIKDDVNYVKTELSGDEKILESAFKLETLYKKYKTVIWGAGAAAILIFAVSAGMEALHQSRLASANQALLTLQQNPSDTNARTVLKENNPSLYELYLFSQAARKGDVKALAGIGSSKNDILADMSRYSVGAIEKKPVDSKLYAELAYLEEAYVAMKNGDAKKAKQKLEMISERSSLSMLAKLLEHSTLKAQ